MKQRSVRALAAAAVLSVAVTAAADDASTPRETVPLPAASELKTAERAVRREFREKLASNDRAARVGVAREMIEQSRAETKPARTHALLLVASEVASECGGVEAALDAADRLADLTEVARGPMAIDLVVKAIKSAHNEAELTATCDEAIAALGRRSAVLETKALDRALTALRSRAKALCTQETAARLKEGMDGLAEKVKKAEKAQAALLAATVKWCEGKMGQQVDRGECTDLAMAATRAAGADESTCSAYFYGRQLGRRETPRPGDVLVLKAVKAHGWHTGPWHVAVVTGAEGLKIQTLHQNWSENRTVHRFTFDLGAIESGSYYFFRPMPKATPGE